MCLCLTGCIDLPVLGGSPQGFDASSFDASFEDMRPDQSRDMALVDQGVSADSSQIIRDRACVKAELVQCNGGVALDGERVSEDECAEIIGCTWRLSATGGMCAPTGCVKHAPGARACQDGGLQAWCALGGFGDLNVPGLDVCALRVGCAQELKGKCAPERCPVVGRYDHCLGQTRWIRVKGFTDQAKAPEFIDAQAFVSVNDCNEQTCEGQCDCQWQGGQMQSCGRAGLSAHLVDSSRCFGGGIEREYSYAVRLKNGRTGRSLYIFKAPKDAMECNMEGCEWFGAQSVCLGRDFGQAIQASETHIEDRCWHSPWLPGCVILECPAMGAIGVLKRRLDALLEPEQVKVLDDPTSFSHTSTPDGRVIVKFMPDSNAAIQLCDAMKLNKALYSE